MIQALSFNLRLCSGAAYRQITHSPGHRLKNTTPLLTVQIVLLQKLIGEGGIEREKKQNIKHQMTNRITVHRLARCCLKDEADRPAAGNSFRTSQQLAQCSDGFLFVSFTSCVVLKTKAEKKTSCFHPVGRVHQL